MPGGGATTLGGGTAISGGGTPNTGCGTQFQINLTTGLTTTSKVNWKMEILNLEVTIACLFIVQWIIITVIRKTINYRSVLRIAQLSKFTVLT